MKMSSDYQRLERVSLGINESRRHPRRALTADESTIPTWVVASRGMRDGFPLALFGRWFCRGGLLGGCCFRWLRQIEVPVATSAKLDVRPVHDRRNHADGHVHVAAGANLVANGG